MLSEAESLPKPELEGIRTGGRIVAFPDAIPRARAKVVSPGFALAGLAVCLVVALVVAVKPAGSALQVSSQPVAPRSWLTHSMVLSVYGRGFGLAPILGRLGQAKSMADLNRQVRPYLQGLRAESGSRTVRPAIHLIYAMATPCAAQSTCLQYLDEQGVNVVRQYIEPAAHRGWLVILDDQLGRSDPTSEVRHMIARGYLRYDNVEVAFDPEFRTVPGQTSPGVPPGNVTAAELNGAERLLESYASSQDLAHSKLMLIHQWSSAMIQGRSRLKSDLPYVEPVVVMDGIGTPGAKAELYSDLLGPASRSTVRWRGIKLFFANPYDHAGHVDAPFMTWRQVLGEDPAFDQDVRPYYLRPAPSVVVLT